MDAADGGPCVLIGGRGDRARIQNHNFGGSWRTGALQSAIRELPFNGSAVGLRRPAAKILNVETRHAYILTYKVGRSARPLSVAIGGYCKGVL